MATVVRMPQLAAGGEEAAIQSWLVAAGDQVARGQTIAEIETEKAVVEYESEVEGTFAAALVGAGDAATVGSPIAVIAGPGESVDAALAAATPHMPQSAAAPAAAASPPVPSPSPAPAAAGSARVFATPLVRRLAAERGVDLGVLSGSGPHGRIVRRDLDRHLASDIAAPPPEPAPAAPPLAAEAAGGFTDVPHTGMRRAIARRLTESTSTVPHFFLVADCAVDALLALRAQINATGAKVSVNDLVVKAVACALRDVPEANAIWTPEATRRFTSVDVAVAVSVPGGLLTPVVHGVERLSIGELSTQTRALAERARAGGLKQQELEGGSFSVSNLGMFGTRQFSAIINPPHSGILAVGAADKRPVVDPEGALTVATLMTVTLSADHRVLDGALAAQWLAAFVRRIEEPLGMLV